MGNFSYIFPVPSPLCSQHHVSFVRFTCLLSVKSVYPLSTQRSTLLDIHQDSCLFLPPSQAHHPLHHHHVLLHPPLLQMRLHARHQHQLLPLPARPMRRLPLNLSTSRRVWFAWCQTIHQRHTNTPRISRHQRRRAIPDTPGPIYTKTRGTAPHHKSPRRHKHLDTRPRDDLTGQRRHES